MRLLKIVFVISVLWSWSVNSQSEEEKLDSIFKYAVTDSQRMKSFEDLFMYQIVRDYDKAKHLLGTMDTLCREINIDHCFPEFLLFNGFYYRMTASYDSSIYFLSEASEAFEAINNFGKQAVCLFNLGVVTSYQGDFDLTADYYLSARDLYQQNNNMNGLINVSNSLGVLYKNIQDYDAAIASFQEGLSVARSNGNVHMEAMINNNIASMYNDNYGSADSIIKYAENALEIESDLQRNTGISSAYNLISAGFIRRNDLQRASQFGEKAVEFSELSGSPRFTAIHLIAVGDIYKKQGDFNKAKDRYVRGIQIADSIGILRHQVTAYKNYSQLLYDNGFFKEAYKQRVQFETLSDSLNVIGSRTEIAELETKYDVAVKESEIKSQALAIEKSNYQRNLLGLGLGLSSLLGVTFLWAFWSRMKKNKKIAIQQQNLQAQKILGLEQEKKLLSMTSLIEGQETERIRIAKELHDGLGGLLTTVKAHFGKIHNQIRELEGLKIYQRASSMIDKAHDEVRRISHNLMPSDLRAGGLPMAVSQIAQELKQSHDKKVEFECIGLENKRLAENIELSVYRVIQELTNNIIKHAEANEILIQIIKSPDDIVVVVEDDGIGFDFDEAQLAGGLGVQSVRSRIEQIEGEIDIDTKMGNGTTVTINIPLRQRNY